MARYFIGVDENGQPFIAHADGEEAPRGARKYLQKIKDYYGKGKSLYIYTQGQLRAFANRGKRKVADAIGLTAKRRRDAALKKVNSGTISATGRAAYLNAMKENQKAYSKSLLGRLEKSAMDVRKAGRKLRNKAGAARKRLAAAGGDALLNARGLARQTGYRLGKVRDRAVERAKDVLGYDERERRDQALANMTYSGYSNASAQAAADSARRAQEEYDRTFLGRREKRQKRRAERRAKRQNNK